MVMNGHEGQLLSVLCDPDIVAGGIDIQPEWHRKVQFHRPSTLPASPSDTTLV